MTRFKRMILAAHTVLVFGMIVADPHQAHRPPDLTAEYPSGIEATAAEV